MSTTSLTEFTNLDELAKAYKGKASTTADASQEYLAMLRSVDALCEVYLRVILSAKDYIEKFKKAFRKKYGHDVFVELTDDCVNVINKLIATIYGYDPSAIKLFIQPDGTYTFDYDGTLDSLALDETTKYNDILENPKLQRMSKEKKLQNI